MARPRVREGEETVRITISMSESDLVELDRLAKRRGGRSAAVRWLLSRAPETVLRGGKKSSVGEKPPTPPIKAQTKAQTQLEEEPREPRPIPAPAPLAVPVAGADPIPLGAGFGTGASAGPQPCPKCGGPTKSLGDGMVECFRCGLRGSV